MKHHYRFKHRIYFRFAEQPRGARKKVRWLLLPSLFLFFVWYGHHLFAVQEPFDGSRVKGGKTIENELSKEQLEKPEIAVVVEKLRELRRKSGNFGPKHPSMELIRRQIGELENQLRSLDQRSKEALPGLPSQATEDPALRQSGLPSGDKRSEFRTPKKARKPPVSSEWGFEGTGQWVKTRQELLKLLSVYSSFPKAYPLINPRNIVAVGPMPALGQVWALEEDPVGNVTHVWEWFDDPLASERRLVAELSGRVKSIYFPSCFEESKSFWCIREIDVGGDAPKGSQVALSREFELLSVSSSSTPPIRLMDNTVTKLGVLRLDADSDIEILSTQQAGWYFNGPVEFKAADPGMDSQSPMVWNSEKGGVWIVEVEEAIAKLKEEGVDSTIVAVLAEDSLDGIRSFRGIKATGIDTSAEKIVIDDIGFPCRKVRRPISKELAWPPRNLSELGWFKSIQDGVLVDVFKRYELSSDGACTFNRFDDFGSLSNQSAIDETLVHEQWICLPKQTKVTLGEGLRPSFPDGMVLVRTISVGKTDESPVDESPADSIPKRRIETRVLLYIHNEWYPFSYAWNADQSDATLVEKEGDVLVIDADGSKEYKNRSWSLPASNACIRCHENTRRRGIAIPSIAKSELERLELFGISRAGGAMTVAGPVELLQKKNWIQGLGFLPKPGPQGELSVELRWFEEHFLNSNVELWYQRAHPVTGFFREDVGSDPKLARTASIVSQSELIYAFAAAYSVSSDPRFLDALQLGARFLEDYFKDESHGGYFRRIDDKGLVADPQKDAYGHAKFVLALALASRVTEDRAYAIEAIRGWEILRDRFITSSGGIASSASEDFSRLSRTESGLDLVVLEALLELYDATRDDRVFEDALRLIETIVVDFQQQPSETDSDAIIPDGEGRIAKAEFGRNANLAFLVARAVELGLPPRLLRFGNSLLDNAMHEGIKAMSEDFTKDPSRVPAARNYALLMRALLRYCSKCGRSDCIDAIRSTRSFIDRHLIDKLNGGWREFGGENSGFVFDPGYLNVSMYIEGIDASKILGNPTASKTE
jgi:hypothetical protein